MCGLERSLLKLVLIRKGIMRLRIWSCFVLRFYSLIAKREKAEKGKSNSAECGVFLDDLARCAVQGRTYAIETKPLFQ